MRRMVLIAAALAVSSASAVAQNKVRGVTDTEIVIGTNTDLSGVAAMLGTANANGWRMAFDEQNEKGGIHGRKIRHIIEDHQYQVPKAIQATNKLINRDEVFATVGNGGTPMTLAMMPLLEEKNVPNVLAFSAAKALYDPYRRLSFAHFASFYDMARSMTNHFAQKGKSAFCSMYNDTDLGHEVIAGIRDQMAKLGKKLTAETAHKPTDTDFSATVAKLYDAKCDVILLGTVVRDTNLIVAAARKLGWKVDFVGPSSVYDSSVAEVPGNVNDGLYATTPFIFAYADDTRPAVREFVANYKKRFGRDPTFAAQVGYSAAGMAIQGLINAGRDLTVDSFVAGMEQIKDHRDIFGAPPMGFKAGDHHGATSTYLTQVKGNKWVQVQAEPIGY